MFVHSRGRNLKYSLQEIDVSGLIFTGDCEQRIHSFRMLHSVSRIRNPMLPTQKPFEYAEYIDRMARTQELLESRGWDALLCYASAIIPGNVLYLSGYETRLRIHDACYLLFTPGIDPETVLFTNASWEDPQDTSWVHSVVVTSMFGQEIAARLPGSVRRLAVAG